jgi:hypothetical protein
VFASARKRPGSEAPEEATLTTPGHQTPSLRSCKKNISVVQDTPPSTVLLSKISATYSQPQSKNIKWKIPEINNS